MTAINAPGTMIRVWFTSPFLPGEGWCDYCLPGEATMTEAEKFGRVVRSRFTRVEILGPVDLDDLG